MTNPYAWQPIATQPSITHEEQCDKWDSADGTMKQVTRWFVIWFDGKEVRVRWNATEGMYETEDDWVVGKPQWWRECVPEPSADYDAATKLKAMLAKQVEPGSALHHVAAIANAFEGQNEFHTVMTMMVDGAPVVVNVGHVRELRELFTTMEAVCRS